MTGIPRLGAVGVALFLAVVLGACGGSGEIVATVDGAPIAKATVAHWMSVLVGPATDPSSPRYLALQGRLVSFLISSQWTVGEATELGLKVTDSEAKTKLEALDYEEREGFPYQGLPQQAELAVLLAKASSTADRLWLARLAVLTSRLDERRVAEAERRVTSAQIVNGYHAHSSRFVVPERRDVEVIITYSEATLQRALREIRSGKNFVAVARRVSADEPLIIGMERHPVREKELARHVFAARAHVLTGPFRQSANHYEFEVTRIHPAHLRALEQVERAVKREIATHLAYTSVAEEQGRKWMPRTSCRAGYVVSECRPGAAS
jgi:hypothetical protein